MHRNLCPNATQCLLDDKDHVVNNVKYLDCDLDDAYLHIKLHVSYIFAILLLQFS